MLSSQRAPLTDKHAQGPLIRDGVEWVPNVAHVFRADGHLYLLYELYDPSRSKAVQPVPANAPGLGRRPQGAIRVLTNLELISGGTKVFETPLVEADAVNTPERNAVSFAFDVPLNSLQPGVYIAQVNVIDDAGGAFSFPRLAVRVVPAEVTTPAAGATAKLPAATAAGAAAR